MRLARASLAAAFLLAGGIAACGSSTSESKLSADAGGDDDASSAETALDDASADVAVDSAPTCALPGTYGSKECMSCVAAKCCEKVTACENDATCKPLQQCVLGCLPKPDAGGCLDDCLAAFPDGVTPWNEVDHCWFGKPPAGCLVECTN